MSEKFEGDTSSQEQTLSLEERAERAKEKMKSCLVEINKMISYCKETGSDPGGFERQKDDLEELLDNNELPVDLPQMLQLNEALLQQEPDLRLDTKNHTLLLPGNWAYLRHDKWVMPQYRGLGGVSAIKEVLRRQDEARRVLQEAGKSSDGSIRAYHGGDDSWFVTTNPDVRFPTYVSDPEPKDGTWVKFKDASGLKSPFYPYSR